MPTPPLTENAERYEVFVVDDDHDSRALMREYLEHRGFRVRSHSDAAQALSEIHEHPPHAVLTDLHMSPVDGATLARSIREDPATRGVAIVALTGQVDAERELVRFFDAYLRKPVDLDLAADVIATLIETALVGLRAPSRP